MKQLVIEAFELVRDGYSVDRVIADPGLNERFLAECSGQGLKATPFELNLFLLNARKRAGVSPGHRRTIVRNQDSFGFAAEMAIRAMERKHETTLDLVLCDPNLAREFDSVAGAISPGFSPLEYRWAALCLRKTKRLRPEIIGRVVAAQVFGPLGVAGLYPSQIPSEQGLYILTTRYRVLYVGEAQDLWSRLKKHFDHSDNKLLARYLWEFGMDDLFLEYHVLPSKTSARVRKAMELELIRSRKADFNVQR